MTLLLLIAFAGAVFGIFIMLKLNITDFSDTIFSALNSNRDSLKSQLKKYNGQKKDNFIKREISEVQNILRITGRSDKFALICTLSLMCSAFGICIALLINNLFLVPVIGFGMLFLPFWYVKLTAVNFKKDMESELETAMSIITNAYLRSEDIITAVDENVSFLNPPTKQIFENFIAQVKYSNPDVVLALRNAKDGINNTFFHEWLDALIMCQNDRNLKTTLTPIVTKLSDMRTVNNEPELILYAPKKEFMMMVVMVIGNIPLIYALNKAWYNSLMHTFPGQIAVAIAGAAIFFSSARVIRLAKPIEFKR
jgi:hypothetical protein